MSESESLTFDENVRLAAECYVDDCGSREAAIEALVERRDNGDPELNGRLKEAISYLRYQEGSE